MPEGKPYPGFHRIHGVEVVPISVLLQTLSAAAAECGASTLSDVRFERPIVVDQPQVIQVVADDESVTVSSAPAVDTPAHRWIRHVSARISHRPEGYPPEGPDNSGDHEMRGFDPSSVAELQAMWGIEGQPFPWSIGSCRSAPDGLHADVDLSEASTVALLDAAVHVARLVDISDPRLMVPAGVESVRLTGVLADARGSVEVRRRGGNGDELIVDIAVKAPDGSTCVDLRGLRFADVESGPALSAPRDADPHTMAHAIEWQPWGEHADRQQPPDAPCTLAILGESDAARTLRDRFADAGYTAADVTEARYVLYLAEPDPVDAAETDIDCAVRLSAEVADLVRRLAERDDRHPATLWIITRGVREAVSDAALRQSCLWGLAGVIGAEQPQLWGGLVDIPVGDDIGDCASALSTVLPTAGQVHPGAARRRIPRARLGAGLRPTGARAVAVSSRRGIPDHRRHGCTRSADGRLARGPRCTSSGTGWPHSVASQARLGQRHQRHGRAPQDRRHPGAGDAWRLRRCRGPRRRITRRGAGSARQAGRRWGSADTRCHTRCRSHRKPTPD